VTQETPRTGRSSPDGRWVGWAGSVHTGRWVSRCLIGHYALAASGAYRVFEVQPCGPGTRLVTRTQNRPTDDATARRFRWSWLVIRAGSKTIRLDVLRAVRRRVSQESERTRGG
jgi:hypothetical protein